MQHPQQNTEKARALMDALDSAAQPVPAAPTDDTTATEKAIDMAMIASVEASVRAALALFDIDYDSYINYDPTAPYGIALSSNPALVEQITQADMPVVAALEVAIAYQPHAEFVQKYGRNPEEVRAAIRKELEEEMAQKKATQPEHPKKPDSRMSPFSGYVGAAAPKAASSDTKSGLDALFNRR